jgi:hypothetical protein
MKTVIVMGKPFDIATLLAIPPHLLALQSLVDRCETAEQKKELIVTAGACEAISLEDGFVMVTANMVEAA